MNAITPPRVLADTLTPAALADALAGQAALAASTAMTRYPNDRQRRLADEAAMLRTLIEATVDQLRAMEPIE